MIDQEYILNIGKHLLHSRKLRTTLPISAQTTTGAQKFTIAAKVERVPSRHENIVEIVIKDKNGTVLNCQEG